MKYVLLNYFASSEWGRRERGSEEVVGETVGDEFEVQDKEGYDGREEVIDDNEVHMTRGVSEQHGDAKNPSDGEGENEEF